jgi:hypothetical protein
MISTDGLTGRIKYEFSAKKAVPQHHLEQLSVLGDAYEQDIDGVDMGFSSLYYLSEHLFSLHDGNRMSGFFTCTDMACSPAFEGERSTYLTAAYLVPEYRNSGGQHKDVLVGALEALVNTLEEDGFDRIRIFPPEMFRSDLMTAIGKEKVLKPLFGVLNARETSGNGTVLGDQWSLQYVFDFDGFKKKLEAPQD